MDIGSKLVQNLLELASCCLYRHSHSDSMHSFAARNYDPCSFGLWVTGCQLPPMAKPPILVPIVLAVEFLAIACVKSKRKDAKKLEE